MAEFKISRIRYKWRGDWNTSTQYYNDDVVKYGGSTWVCFRQHESSTFAEDQTFLVNSGDTDPTPAWEKMTDGYAWRSEWQASTLYNEGDIVIYKGTVYQCIESYTSTSVFDDGISNWSVYASSSAFQNDWTAGVRYGIGDLVKYNGIVYQCVSGHTADDTVNGLEADQEKWEIAFDGVEFTGVWSTGTRYRKNDLVLYGGTLFRCKKGHTPGTDSTIDFDQDEFWDIEFPGFQYDNEWNASTVYQVGDLVKYGGYLFYSLTTNYNSAPIDSIYQIEDRTDPIDWEIVSENINFRGDWDSSIDYKTGDLVRRGGNTYVALIDTTTDGSSLDYLDASNWKVVTSGQNWKNVWTKDVEYAPNDVVIYLGDTYKCTTAHTSEVNNYPGDNGSGYSYWELILQSSSESGLQQRGDLLTYDLSRVPADDGSTFGPTPVTLGSSGEVLTIDNNDSIIYRNYREANRVFFVDKSGVDDLTDSQRGISRFKPWRTVRFAAEQADDGYSGTTTIKVGAGLYSETLPIIVPAKTAIVGSELRSTTISAASAVANLSLDSTYTNAVLTRISQIIQAVIAGDELVPAKSIGNTEDPVIVTEEITTNISFDPPQFDPETTEEIFQSSTTVTQQVTTDPNVAIDIQQLIADIQMYINYHINETGSEPTLSGTNIEVTTQNVLNSIAVLEANRNFLMAEAVAFMQQNYPGYSFDSSQCMRDISRYIDAWKYDIKYPGNYKSLLAARYYRNAVLGSTSEDMFYFRDATGLRNCTLQGLTGSLTPVESAPLNQLPTGGAYVSLDPGWGPADDRTWINNRSPYIQGVTTIGTACVGKKVDGALHAGGNKSMVSNDFTQVISDGVGAWVTNNARAELVSVFTYYAHIGYLSTVGGIIRATNGNNSYGRYGSLADGIDETEVPKTASTYTRAQQAFVANAFAGDFVDEIQILEWSHAGEDYTQATASFVGSGANAEVVFEDFRDNSVFTVRKLDTSETNVPSTGGGGYTVAQNNAQTGNTTSITLSVTDDNLEENYIGMRIVLTSGPGTGQYGYITAYNALTKVAQVSRESDDVAGWDHVIAGKNIEGSLNTGTTYRIEPRVIFSAPDYSASEITVPVTTAWGEITYGETTETYTSITATVVDIEEGRTVPTGAAFNVSKIGRDYEVSISAGGAGYTTGDVLLITGDNLGGNTPINDLYLQVMSVTDDSTNSITLIALKTYGAGNDNLAASGRFIVTSLGGTATLYSTDGENWDSTAMPTSGDWNCVASGDNRFVAIQTGSDAAASSLDGITWTARTMPSIQNWNSVVYGGGVFVAIAGDDNAGATSEDGITWSATTLPEFGDSTVNEWIDIAYGKNRFVALSNSGNTVAVGEYDTNTNIMTWTPHNMDAIIDSTSKSWISIAYGNDRFVAITDTGDVAYSFNGHEWIEASMPTEDGSTLHDWKKIKYAQGVFFAVGSTRGDITTTTFSATSFDGVVWTTRLLASEEDWISVGFGNPYIELLDSSVGKKSPVWIAIPNNTSNFNKIQTGARALGRVNISAGAVVDVRLWDTGSGYLEPPEMILIDPNNTSDAQFECRLGDGVLTNPSWINRGIGYRTLSTTVTVTGDGYADVIPVGKFIVLNDLETYPSPGDQITISGIDKIYTIVTINEIGQTDRGLAAMIRVNPEITVKDKLEHLTPVSIRTNYSQVRITGHDFLDVGTGNFEETMYPELYNTGNFSSAPENEVYEGNGGRVFYASTDQNGNFRSGELFAVEQATGTVTVSSDFFDLGGLSELRLGGVRVGGTGAVIREFSTDPLFTEDSNNIVPTQRAIRAYLEGRLSIGGSEIAVGSFIAGTIKVGPDTISNVAGLPVVFAKRADFEGPNTGISGSILAQTMFYKSF